MFSKIKKTKFNVLALVAINIILFLFVIPSFTIHLGEAQLKYPEIDGSLFYPGSTVGNVKEGRGLYSTYQIKSTPDLTEAELTDEQKDSLYNESLARFQNRANIAGLYDVEIYRDGESIVFDYPKYYSAIENLTNQLSARAQIQFVSQDGGTLLDLYDYDIIGAVTQTYLPALGNHLVVNFNSEKLPQISAALSGDLTQGYFYMNIDGMQAFFVAKTQFTSDPDTVLRMIPVSRDANTNRSLAIVKSYFTESSASEYAFTPETEVSENPVNFPLNNLASQFIFGAGFVMLFTAVMYWINRKEFGKRHLLIVILFVLTTLALLKLSSAVLSIATYIAMIVLLCKGVYVLYAYFKGIWYTNHILRNSFIALLAIVIILGPLTKNWVIYDIVGVAAAVLSGFILSILVHQTVNAKPKK